MNFAVDSRATRPSVVRLDWRRPGGVRAGLRARVTPVLACTSAPDRPPGEPGPHVHHPLEPSHRCALCEPVHILCSWAPRPPARWKRPVLTLSALATILLSIVMGIVVEWEFAEKINTTQPHRVLGHAVLGLSLLATGIAGAVVAAFGCDRCVARLTGEF
jgi:hypothetical protein